MSLLPSKPIRAAYPSTHLTHASGACIFHLATSRVVLCYHTRDNYYFLPKGRRDIHETSTACAEREGYEESGFVNRVLPLPVKGWQTGGEKYPKTVEGGVVDGRFVVEPIWIELLPLSSRRQYLLFWFICETLLPPPPHNTPSAPPQKPISHPVSPSQYQPPTPFPQGLTLQQRIEQDSLPSSSDRKEQVYEPPRHEGTGVDEEEMLYTSSLVPIEEARRKLRGTVMEDVVARGWEYVLLRKQMESEDEEGQWETIS